MVERSVKKIEVPMVKLEIEISEKFYNDIQKGKEELKEKHDWELTDGEYLERAVEDFVVIILGLQKEIQMIKNEQVFPGDLEGNMYG